MTPAEPLRVAIVNDHELVVRGVHALLGDHPDTVVVVELDSNVPVAQPVDIALYDAFTMEGLDSPAMADLLSSPLVGAVVLYTWNVVPEIVEHARDLGVAGVLSKTLGTDALVAALARVGQQLPAAEGDPRRMPELIVEPAPLSPRTAARLPVTKGDWPGRAEGLTFREAEVIALITAGLSNQQIAERIHLSINSIKTYIRTAYRTMDVTTRSQAVLWGLDHGLSPRRARVQLAWPQHADSPKERSHSGV